MIGIESIGILETRTVALDTTSEGTETSILNIRTGSTSGPIIATSIF